MRQFPVFLFFALFWYAALTPSAAANNITLSNVLTGYQDTSADTMDIQFDLAWDNSWRIAGAPASNANWDAAWVFARFRVFDTGGSSWGDWTSCTLSKTDADHSAPSGSQIDTGCSPSAACGGGDSGRGVFIYRDSTGTGSVDWDGARLRWLYGSDGVGDADQVQVRVFAIEMVHVPTGDFYIGDGSTADARFQYTTGVSPVLITASLGNAVNAYTTTGTIYDDAVLRNGGAGIRIDGDGGLYDSTGTSVNVRFPTGYNAFYIMKYELSQGQYRDFLNTLTRTQQAALTRVASIASDQYCLSNTTTVNYRSGIRVPTTVPAGVITFGCDLEGITAHNTTAGDKTFNESNDGEWVAMNYATWMDVAAFADWAGLRPFTELEYEKAARGPATAVAREYAWGDTTIETAATSLTDSGQSTEVPDQGNMNYSASSPDGPYRLGSMADASSTRANAGASYYGVMDLSGSMWERTVTVGESTLGRLFEGSHGNGSLDSTTGNADVNGWPGDSNAWTAGGTVTGATGSGFRGGNWLRDAAYARVSDRTYAANTNTDRFSDYGVRVARTAP